MIYAATGTVVDRRDRSSPGRTGGCSPRHPEPFAFADVCPETTTVQAVAIGLRTSRRSGCRPTAGCCLASSPGNTAPTGRRLWVPYLRRGWVPADCT
jgi:hypothetical protein